MPLGAGQKNNLLNLTLDLWEDQVFFNEHAYPAGHFAASVMNRTVDQNTDLLVKAGHLLQDLSAFMKADKQNARAILDRIKPQLVSLLDDIWRIEPFSLLDKDNELTTIATLFSEQYLDRLMCEDSRELEFFLRYVNGFIRVGQAVVNFSSVAWTLEAKYLHHLKKRNETFYVHAVMDCFQNKALWEEVKKYELLPVENFTLSPKLQAGTALLRHPSKDMTMVFATRFLFDQYIDFYIYDLMNGLHCGHAPFLCENCGRYYLATTGYMTKYCDGVSPQNQKYTCRQYGALNHQKEQNKNHPIYRLFKTRTNSIRKQHERGQISAELRKTAITLAETYRDKALFDNAYAAAGYARDMELANLCAEAERRLGG